MAHLTFLGATGTVTGSRFLLENDGFRLLVECGLFQGLKELRLRNWLPPPVDPKTIDAVLLTHAHLDHSGFLPVLTRLGFAGPVLATSATCALCAILLPDAGHLQEEDARFANKRGFSKHRPALPLYTEEEARQCLDRLRPVPFQEALQIHESVSVRFRPAGHILGAALTEVHLRVAGKHAGENERTVLFSGDLGRPGQPIIPDPAPLAPCDHLVLDSTYGGRDHPRENPKDQLKEVIVETAARGGVVLIPAFTVGRTQTLLYLLRELQLAERLPVDIPIYIDSPMAIHATRVFMDHPEALDAETRKRQAAGGDPLGLRNIHMVIRVEDSKALNSLRYPAIVISASGMATGGRILHHLAHRLDDHRNTVLLVGYQAAGTRGRALEEGAKSVRIHGRDVAVRARIVSLENTSAHADRSETIAWLRAAKAPPGRIHLVHGEPESMEALADRIRTDLGLETHVPSYQERVTLAVR
jgi:metallo-beta-lactamase family protein